MEQSINELFNISMKSLEEMIDVNTVVGDIKVINENISVIPISKVKCAFATGGFKKESDTVNANPLGGATGGQMSINPVAFLVINGEEIKVLHLEENTHVIEKLIDGGLEVAQEIKKMVNKKE